MPFSRIWPVTLASLALSFTEAAVAMKCFAMVNSELISFYLALPCGVVTPDSGFTTCCNNDRNTVCLQDGICKSPSNGGNGYTSYYIGGCTDPTYQDKSCSPYCRGFAHSDIVYNGTTKTWTCCGTQEDGSVNCSSPTTEKFNALAPVDLSATYTIGTAVVTGPATSSILFASSSSSLIVTQTSPSTSSSQTATQASSPSHDLSTGAKAGIGIGAVIGVILVITGILLYLKRRRKASTETQQTREYPYTQAHPVYEKDTKSNTLEMDARIIHEM